MFAALMAGLYFHIPFCKQACHYCDFHFSTNLAFKDQMLDMMVRELEIRREYLNEEIGTIYFGGGTPSLLSPQEIDRLLNAVYKLFRVNRDAEITLETNPDDTSAAKLLDLRALGVNRLSIGIQSFDDRVLRFMNRAHSSESAHQTIKDARNAKFENISIDLMYAIPGVAEADWRLQIDEVVNYQPEHISAYSLTIEEKTAFGNWLARGKLSPVSDDDTVAQMNVLLEHLSNAGYERYEVSNFARPGFYSRHNTSYWKGIPYLGIGPGAHSYNRTSREYNIRNNHIYIREVALGNIPATVEVLTTEEKINDYILTTLRTIWGMDLEHIRADFSYDISSTKQSYIRSLIGNQLAVLNGSRLILTPAGLALADKISADLFVES